MSELQRKIKQVEMCGELVDVVFTEMIRPTTKEALEQLDPETRMNHKYLSPFNPTTYLAEDGIECMQDVAVTMRDGIKIYADIYKPVGAGPVPLIVSWSFYGKRPFDGQSEWQIMGVPPGTVSNMSKFESADPGYWCRRGFAVANVDPRGIGHSEGDYILFGTQDGRDGYDFIEWAAEQPWCNSRVALSGNSCVAMTQWRIASQCPPHLACIAPWEGTSDMYRESLYEGGIPAHAFVSMVLRDAVGPNYVDNMVLNAQKHPFINSPYWKDKDPDWNAIKVPVYVTACWNHFHLRGSINGFRKLKTSKKWLRAHRDFEWPDAYGNKYLSELELFFNRYLKLERNGWELTPRVRVEVQDAYDYDYQTDRPEDSFPLKRTQYEKLYLNAANMTMLNGPVEDESQVAYEGATEEVCFDYRFTEETELTGFLKLRLWVEADGHDDMDLFINIQKLSTNGEWLPITIFGEPHPGAWGKMRVSRRRLDPKLSTDFQPVQAHTCDEKLKQGEIVPVDIEIWPTSRIWHKGQQIRVQIAGRYIREDWFEPLQWESNNKGSHIIHTGGKYDSFLQIPVIPPRYQDGDYIYR